MKLTCLLITCIMLVFTNNINSQTDTDAETRIKNLEEKLESLNKSIEEETNIKSKSNSEIVQFRENNIRKSAQFLIKFNSNVAFQNEIQGTNLYLTYVVDINNANNDLLGFSLKDKITEFLTPITIELSDKRAGLFNGLIKNIIDIPIVGNVVKTAGSIVNSPVFQTITSVLPISSTLSSVSSFVAAAIFSLNDGDLNVDMVYQFQSNLSSIFGIYSKLDNLNNNFNNEQINLQVKTQSLRSKLHSQLIEQTQRLYKTESVSNDMNEYQIISSYYSGNKLDDQIKKIKSNSNSNVLVNDSRLQYSPEEKTVLEEMYQEYSQITVEYKNSYINLNNGLIDLLSNDQDLNNTLTAGQKQRRDETLRMLTQKFSPIENGDFFKNELKSLKDELDAIKKYYEV